MTSNTDQWLSNPSCNPFLWPICNKQGRPSITYPNLSTLPNPPHPYVSCIRISTVTMQESSHYRPSSIVHRPRTACSFHPSILQSKETKKCVSCHQSRLSGWVEFVRRLRFWMECNWSPLLNHVSVSVSISVPYLYRVVRLLRHLTINSNEVYHLRRSPAIPQHRARPSHRLRVAPECPG